MFRARLLPITILSGFIYTLLFFFTYLPQAAFLAIFQGVTSAFINTVFLVLGEGAAIVALLFEAFFVDETLVDVFDAVLLSRSEAVFNSSGNSDEAGNGPVPGIHSLIAQTREIDQEAPDPVKRLGKPKNSVVYAPFSLRQIVEFIVLLPLNLIPIAGTPMFLVLTGYRAGPLHHWRYFELRGFTKGERKDFVSRRQLRYTW